MKKKRKKKPKPKPMKIKVKFLWFKVTFYIPLPPAKKHPRAKKTKRFLTNSILLVLFFLLIAASVCLYVI